MKESTMADHWAGCSGLPLPVQLRRVVETSDYVDALRRSARMAELGARSPEPAALADELAVLIDDGVLAGMLVIEVLAGLRHGRADELLISLLDHPERLVRRHAGWRLGRRRIAVRAVPQLLDQLAIGGIDTMHAHRTLRAWSAFDPATIARLAARRLGTTDDPARRARLIDLVGVIADPATDDLLLHRASDRDESVPSRLAAIGALGQRSGGRIDEGLRRLAKLDDDIGDHAALALLDRSIPSDVTCRSTDGGLRIGQFTLAGGLDGQLSLGGRGDTGGVANLLVSLSEALSRRHDVEHVLTIGRGTVADAITGTVNAGEALPSFGMIVVGDDARPGVAAIDLWEHLPAIERGIRRVLRRQGPVDLLHLRMADVGTLAGAAIARELGIPICFSLAPDPHNVLLSLQERGELDLDSFLRLETESHVWFRARLVEQMANEADRLALFPRSRSLELLTDPGSESDDLAQRSSIVAEGIDIGLLRRAETEHAPTRPNSRLANVLDDLAIEIPASRRDLPLVLSVGRLHPIKGMDRVVAAWASDPLLTESCNLVIVGGNFEDPSPTEQSVLDAIDRALPRSDARRQGLVLLGGRPRADVARLLVAAVRGRVGCWSSGGIYVDGALKEEFGLAVIEALAAGLVVVAPSIGGPPTYVDHGDFGVLVDPDGDLATAMRDAFGLVDRPSRSRRAREMVEQRYSIDTMAAQLVELYRPAAALL